MPLAAEVQAIRFSVEPRDFSHLQYDPDFRMIVEVTVDRDLVDQIDPGGIPPDARFDLHIAAVTGLQLFSHALVWQMERAPVKRGDATG